VTHNSLKTDKYQEIYLRFNSPITTLDCGKKCAPHNVGGKPFCCDISHAVPTAYEHEWNYLQKNTNLWHLWKANSLGETPEEAKVEYESLRLETPDNMILLECLGPESCERDYRALTCRQFPFFPYIDSEGEFLGLTYYWEYEETCWLISNLERVTEVYHQEFVDTFNNIFSEMPEERIAYQIHSGYMRDEFEKMNRTISLLHQDGNLYQINPRNEGLKIIKFNQLEKYGPYGVVADMPFPDEIE
jgi:hypothetical protein